jgi:site-specific DNA-cytosine methylase
VFVIAIFNPVLAERCPNPLLPVAESLPRHLAKSKPKRQSTTSKTATSIGTDGGILGSDIIGSLNTSDAKMISSQYVNENKCVVEPMLIDGTRVNDVRIYEEPVQTLKERMGTGGNNVPMLAFDTQFGSNANVTENIAPTLKSSQAPPSVAYGIQGNMIGRQDHNGPLGKGHTEEDDPMFTLTSTDIHAVAYDEYNDTIGATHHALRAGTKQSTGVLEPTMAVRRLTPLECERLMGWPDDHTRYKADGTEQADTHRYKQCGNGVASPVAQWIAKHLLKLEEQQ